MSTLENRIKALDFASTLPVSVNWQTAASDALNFLETGSFQPAASEAPKASAGKTRKATSAPAVAAAAEAPAPVASPVSTQAETGSAQVAALVAAAGITLAKEPTLDDVRLALVQLASRKGSKEASNAILGKYAPSGTTGTLKKEDFAKVISECNAA